MDRAVSDGKLDDDGGGEHPIEPVRVIELAPVGRAEREWQVTWGPDRPSSGDMEVADMPGIPTELLADQIQETNRRLVESNGRLADEIHSLAAEMRESNQRLASELRESNQRLTDAITGLSRDFGNFRVEVAKELFFFGRFGEVNAKLGTTATLLRYVGRGVAILTPVVIGLIGSAIGFTWYAAKLDSRVERVEKAVGAAEKPGAVRR